VALCGELGPVAAEALPLLEGRMQDSNRWMRVYAAQAAWRVSGRVERSLPMLVAVLDSFAVPHPRGRPVDDHLLVLTIEAIGEMGAAGQAPHRRTQRLPAPQPPPLNAGPSLRPADRAPPRG
jgi:hypothetical protein